MGKSTKCEDYDIEEVRESAKEILKFVTAEAKLMKSNGNLDSKIIVIYVAMLSEIVKSIAVNNVSFHEKEFKIRTMKEGLNTIFSNFYKVFGEVFKNTSHKDLKP